MENRLSLQEVNLGASCLSCLSISSRLGGLRVEGLYTTEEIQVCCPPSCRGGAEWFCPDSPTAMSLAWKATWSTRTSPPGRRIGMDNGAFKG